MQFEFATANRILFGDGTARLVPPAAAEMGKRALLVTGASGERALPLSPALQTSGVATVPFRVPGEPTVELIRQGAEYAREARCDLVIAMGGGSAIDAGKALAAMLTNPGEPLDYLEVIGRGQRLAHPSAPFIVIPTTAGTGSEVTRNSVLVAHEHGVKASLRSSYLLPRLAAIDPELTLALPPALTAYTGLDALTQLIEPYVSVRANPMTDLFCREGIRRASSALPRAWQNGNDREARAGMCWASLLGGLSLANAGLGAVHGFAAAIGGRFSAPHGAVCAALLPHAMGINIQALRRRAPEGQALGRYGEIAGLVTGRPDATAEQGARWVAELCRQLEIPGLRAYGVTAADLPALIDDAARASSMKANPITLTREELHEIVAASL